MADTDSKVLGVVLLVRHGDRQGFYQSPTTYTPSNTILTPLGNQQEFQLGTHLQSLYLNDSSPCRIEGISNTLVNYTQLRVRADAGGEAGVILNSAQSLLQGLFPANSNSSTVLANGTTITAPLAGYQYIPIESVEPQNDISLEGWTSCNTFNQATSEFYNSLAFHHMASDHANFINSLSPYLDGRPVTLENMWNIFDFMNVQSIHNAAFARALPPTYLEQARYLANWHEYNVFSDPRPDGIKNIAGRTILPSILAGFKSIVDPSDPVKFIYHAISYKPFISLFNITRATEAVPGLAGIVDYAAAVALEVRQPPSGQPVLRFKFKNGTDPELKRYPFFGSATDVPLQDFVNSVEPLGIDSLSEWCTLCNNQQDRGCGALNLAATSAVAANRPAIGSVGAGFLGAGVMLALALAMFGVLLFLGVLTVGPGRSKRKRSATASVASFSSRPC
ncbi:putative HCO3- transporter family protein [Lyophyllum shimeji]|uniref:HCO3- transporter family protein n=1 Tax=Lyophyllum shimeji TaxID=47721 RepID=A0A9P3UKM1_LYOSH|nr:putative HCO3- transporter family protein [Lyophyllum shimeji]